MNVRNTLATQKHFVMDLLSTINNYPTMKGKCKRKVSNLKVRPIHVGMDVEHPKHGHMKVVLRISFGSPMDEQPLIQLGMVGILKPN